MKERTKGKVRGIWANPKGLPARNETRRVGWAVGRAGKPSRSAWPRPPESGETRRARDGGRRGVSSEDLGERRGVVGAKGQERARLALRARTTGAASLTQCVLRWLTQNTTDQASVLTLLCIARDTISALLSNRAIVCTLPCRGALQELRDRAPSRTFPHVHSESRVTRHRQGRRALMDLGTFNRVQTTHDRVRKRALGQSDCYMDRRFRA